MTHTLLPLMRQDTGRDRLAVIAGLETWMSRLPWPLEYLFAIENYFLYRGAGALSHLEEVSAS